jgi:hypothetical protein
MGTTRQSHPGHTGLVGLPILLTAVFCFALVLVNPHRTENSSVRTSKAASSPKSSISDKTQAQSKLSPAPSSQSSITTTDPASAASSGQTGSGQSSKTGTPQPIAEAGKGLQSAVPDDRSGSIVYKVTQPVRQTLDNLKH